MAKAKEMAPWDREDAEVAPWDREEPAAVVEKAQPVRSVPPRNTAELKARIKAGEFELPGGIKTAWDALMESNREVGQQLADRTLLGAPGRALRAVGQFGEPVQPIPAPGASKRPEDYLPTEATLSGVPAAAIDMASMGGAAGKAGETLGQLPAAAARRLGASEAATVVRPGLQTAANVAGAGAVYGGSDAAMRGGDVVDVVEGAGQGALGNLVLSNVPAAAGKVAQAARNAITTRAVKPLVGIGQGVKADKALAGLGKGDVELGEQEMRRVIEQEGLAPVVNAKASKMGNAFEERLDEVWRKELGPVRAKALETEPEAKIPVKKIEERLRSLVAKTEAGTDVHDDVEKAIGLLKARAGTIGNKGQFPVENLLKNAQEFERDGFGKSQPKFADGATARAIGKTLRLLTDERIGQIYAKNPKLVREVLGRKEAAPVPRLLPTGEENPEYIPPRAARPWARTQEDALDLELLGEKYAAARKRYADLKKIEPLIDQLAKRRAEHRPGLISTMKHGLGNLTFGTLGYGVGGGKGMAAGVLGHEVASRAMPYAERATYRLSEPFAGPAVDPLLGGAVAAASKKDKGDD